MAKKIPQDIVGTIAILKFKKHMPWILKKYKAYKFLKAHKNVTTVVEKTDAFSGELRIPTTKYLAGVKTYETLYKENDCTFVFDINKTYFSPRLSQERKMVAQDIAKSIKKTKKNTRILVCFSGVAPFPIAIAKELKKQQKEAKIIANELNADACMYAKENVRRNKLRDYITVVCDDAKNLPKDFTKKSDKFDSIVMPRPNLDDTFLKEILNVAKKGTKIYYHGFGTEEKVRKEIEKDTKNNIKNLTLRKAGDIGKEKFRYHAEFSVK